MPTDPTITDLLLPLRELHTRERRLHLDNTTNGGLLTRPIHRTIVILILTPMTPTHLAAAETNTTRKNLENLMDGVGAVKLTIHATQLKKEDGFNGMTVVLPHHHIPNLCLGRHLLRMKVEGQPGTTGLRRMPGLCHPTREVRLDLKWTRDGGRETLGGASMGVKMDARTAEERILQHGEVTQVGNHAGRKAKAEGGSILQAKAKTTTITALQQMTGPGSQLLHGAKNVAVPKVKATRKISGATSQTKTRREEDGIVPTSRTNTNISSSRNETGGVMMVASTSKSYTLHLLSY